MRYTSYRVHACVNTPGQSAVIVCNFFFFCERQREREREREGRRKTLALTAINPLQHLQQSPRDVTARLRNLLLIPRLRGLGIRCKRTLCGAVDQRTTGDPARRIQVLYQVWFFNERHVSLAREKIAFRQSCSFCCLFGGHHGYKSERGAGIDLSFLPELCAPFVRTGIHLGR